jgi:hypothetical protein
MVLFIRDVRFTAESGHSPTRSGCLLCAKSGLMHPQQKIGGLGQMLTNFCQELARAEGLRHIVITASRPRLLFLAAEGVRGDGDDRDRAQRRIGFNTNRSSSSSSVAAIAAINFSSSIVAHQS